MEGGITFELDDETSKYVKVPRCVAILVFSCSGFENLDSGGDVTRGEGRGRKVSGIDMCLSPPGMILMVLRN